MLPTSLRARDGNGATAASGSGIQRAATWSPLRWPQPGIESRLVVRCRRRFRGGLLTDGNRVTWEYPRRSPDGDQLDIVEVMEVRDGLIAAHRVYWGWLGMSMLLRGEHSR